MGDGGGGVAVVVAAAPRPPAAALERAQCCRCTNSIVTGLTDLWPFAKAVFVKD